jgi:hypothetical protein
VKLFYSLSSLTFYHQQYYDYSLAILLLLLLFCNIIIIPLLASFQIFGRQLTSNPKPGSRDQNDNIPEFDDERLEFHIPEDIQV